MGKGRSVKGLSRAEFRALERIAEEVGGRTSDLRERLPAASRAKDGGIRVDPARLEAYLEGDPVTAALERHVGIRPGEAIGVRPSLPQYSVDSSLAQTGVQIRRAFKSGPTQAFLANTITPWLTTHLLEAQEAQEAAAGMWAGATLFAKKERQYLSASSSNPDPFVFDTSERPTKGPGGASDQYIATGSDDVAESKGRRSVVGWKRFVTGVRRLFGRGKDEDKSRRADDAFLSLIADHDHLREVARKRFGEERPEKVIYHLMKGELGREPTDMEVRMFMDHELRETLISSLGITGIASKSDQIFQVYTREFLDAYASYLMKLCNDFYEQHGRYPKIVEVGAGDGRFSRSLNQRLERFGVRITATDFFAESDGETDSSGVARESAVSAAWNADIIIGNWMTGERRGGGHDAVYLDKEADFDVALAHLLTLMPEKTLIVIGTGEDTRYVTTNSLEFFDYSNKYLQTVEPDILNKLRINGHDTYLPISIFDLMNPVSAPITHVTVFRSREGTEIPNVPAPSEGEKPIIKADYRPVEPGDRPENEFTDLVEYIEQEHPDSAMNYLPTLVMTDWITDKIGLLKLFAGDYGYVLAVLDDVIRAIDSADWIQNKEGLLISLSSEKGVSSNYRSDIFYDFEHIIDPIERSKVADKYRTLNRILSLCRSMYGADFLEVAQVIVRDEEIRLFLEGKLNAVDISISLSYYSFLLTHVYPDSFDQDGEVVKFGETEESKTLVLNLIRAIERMRASGVEVRNIGEIEEDLLGIGYDLNSLSLRD